MKGYNRKVPLKNPVVCEKDEEKRGECFHFVNSLFFFTFYEYVSFIVFLCPRYIYLDLMDDIKLYSLSNGAERGLVLSLGKFDCQLYECAGEGSALCTGQVLRFVHQWSRYRGSRCVVFRGVLFEIMVSRTDLFFF